jgi:hypothetical protein
MNEPDILALNERIQENIFAYQVSELPAQVTGFFETIVASGILSRLTANEIQRFNQFFEGCLQSLQNQDYLNLADLLNYEITPTLTRK